MSPHLTRTRLAVITALTLGPALTGAAIASGYDAGATAATAPGASTTVTVSQPGTITRKVTLNRGRRLTISLVDNNPSTGYSWSYTTKPSTKVLALVSDKTAKEPAANPPVTGAPQPRTIIYRAVAKGSTRLALVYLPPGRPHGKPAATLKLTIRVP
jgi:predicted secreted protein